MMKKYYRFAGVEFEISIPEEQNIEERTLGRFASAETENPEKYCFERKKELDEPEGILIASMNGSRIYKNGDQIVRYIGPVEKEWDPAHMRILTDKKQHYVQLKKDSYHNGFGGKTILNAMGVENLLYRYDALILHASFIQVNGKAVLFTAPSETGKSTQAELWKKLRGAEIINGDRAALRIERTKEIEEITACGIPFSGSSKDCINAAFPVEAIVYLGQAPETTINSLKGVQAFRKIWEQVTVPVWNREAVEKTSFLIEKIINSVPIYQMDCTPDERAVVALEQMIMEKKSQTSRSDEKKGNDILHEK